MKKLQSDEHTDQRTSASLREIRIGKLDERNVMSEVANQQRRRRCVMKSPQTRSERRRYARLRCHVPVCA